MPTQPQESPQESQAPRVAVPELSVPREGKINGYGETFQPDSFTGTAQLSFPIPLSAARGAEPALALAYGSGQGNGPFGLGFALDLPAISVRTDKGIPRYEGHDTFLLGGEPLVPRYDRDGEGWKRDERTANLDGAVWRVEGYRPRTEQSFSRIERWTRAGGDTAGESFWRLTDREDRVSTFGRSAGARVADPAEPRRVYQWLLEETADSHGNRALYRYKREDGAGLPERIYDAGHELRANLYPERILYGNYREPARDDAGNEQFAFEVLFDYGEYDLEPPVLEPVRPWPARADCFSTFRPGFEVRTCRLCRNVLMLHRFPEELGPGPCLVGALRLRYDENPVASRLTAIQRVGYSRTEDTGGERYLEQALPPAELAYTPFAPEEQRLQPLEVRAPGLLPGAPGQPGYQMVDLYGDGLAGILYQEGETLLYWRPLGEAAYDPPVPLPLAPTEHDVSGSGLAASGVTLMDVAGNGHLDVVVARTGRGGFYRNGNDGGWSPYRDFAAYTPEMANPRAELVDVSGEGVADLLIPNPGSFTYYPLLGDEGFGAPGAGAVPDGFPPVGSGAGPVFTAFADLFGDGLAHRIRLRSGLTEVWPNLGYGRFGERILLGNTPQLLNVSPERVFLADVDGSGTADLVVLFTDHANVYLNQSGNAWSEPIRVPLPCGVDVLDTASVADVFGTGSPALVIGKPGPVPKQFVFDFTGGRRPHLLESYRDNLGSGRRLAYRSSTSYFLAARRAGNPWVTKLAFPVQVVAEAESHDEIADRRSRQVFQYRDGYYDPLERELRGFAYMEAVEIREDTGVQPALTRTWNDTGAWMEQEALLRQMREESFQGDPLALTLPAAVFAPDIATGPADTVRQAHRALKGSPLRSERYALDGSGADRGPLGAPLSVAQTCYAVTMVQPPLDGHPGVFHVTVRESAESAYEGRADDPRIAHSFTLEVDGFGNVRRAASVAYPRRKVTGQPDLPAQRRLLGTVTLADFFNHPGEDFYRLGLAWQERQLELGGLAPGAPGNPGDHRRYFTFDEIRAQVEQALAAPLPYGQPFTPGAVQSRLFAHQRSRYWDAGLAAPLPFGEATAQALLYDDQRAVFPPAYVTEVYGTRVTAEDLERRAGYQQADGLWWNPGSVAFYDGAARFYQLRAARDPFGQTAEIRHDRYCLAVTGIVDPLGQETRARIDYQALQPSAVTDVNGNVAEAIYGPLGQPVALSLHGFKDGAPVGNMSLDGYVLHPDATTESVLTDPAKYLQGASLYRLYDVQSWWRSAQGRRQPVHEVVLERERWLYPEPGKGPDETTPVRVSLTYLDGGERALCRKIKVEAAALASGTEGFLWLTPDQVVYDQVKEPVRRFNPFAAADPSFQADPDAPFASLFYDAAGRLRRTDSADGSWEETRYTSWAETHWDADDTDPDSPFHDTPTTRALDVLGRAFLETRVNLVEVAGKTERQELSTCEWLDVAGNRLRVADPRFYDPAKPGEPAHYNFVDAYAMDGLRLSSLGADAGSRLSLQDAVGKTVLAWDGRGLRLATRYDALRRPVEVRLTGGGLDLVAERFEYGADPERNNRGQVVRHDDPAGVLRTPDYDLLGKAVREERQVARDYTTPVDWSRPDGVPLLPDVWRTATTYDALGQAVSQTGADGSRIEPAYYLNGWLSRSRVRLPGDQEAWTVAGPLRYGAAGQVVAMPLANGVSCEKTYDPRNLRLVGVAAARDVGGGGGGGGEPLQDLAYRYDRVGNVTRVEDALQTTVFFRNREVKAVRELGYDALYRLRSATGRQQAPGSSTSNGQALEPYLEQYDYDASGNLTRIRHTAPSPDGNWTRDIAVSDSSDRAVPKTMLAGGKRPDDFFDGDGNLLELEHLRALTWDPFDQLAAATVIERQDGPSDAVWFVYDAAGNRVRKVLQRYAHGGELIETVDTLYLGDVLVTRQSAGSGGGAPRVTSEATALRISAGGHCVLLTETATAATLVDRTFRYQLDDALGSVSLELDEQARIITYEEYFPYGGTALIGGASQAEVDRKRYRFTGKELDRATGLYYFGARYYVPWLGRWLNPDPSGPVDGLNLYEYVGNNPVSYLDPDGRGRLLQSAASLGTGGASLLRSRLRLRPTPVTSTAVVPYRPPVTAVTLYRRRPSAVAVTASYRPPVEQRVYYIKVGAYSKAPSNPIFVGQGHGHAFVEIGLRRGNRVIQSIPVGVSATDYSAAYGQGIYARAQSVFRLATEGVPALLHPDAGSFAQPETVSVTFRISKAEFLAAQAEIALWKKAIAEQRYRYSLAYQCASFARAVAVSAGIRELFFGLFFANPKALAQSLQLVKLGKVPNPYAEGASGLPANLARRIIGKK